MRRLVARRAMVPVRKTDEKNRDRAAPRAPAAKVTPVAQAIWSGVAPPRKAQLESTGTPQRSRVPAWVRQARHLPNATLDGFRGVQTSSPSVPRRTSIVTRSEAAEIEARITRSACSSTKEWNRLRPIPAAADGLNQARPTRKSAE